ncbi:cytochrome C [Burkholderia cenocepacia]|uniref:c-type cytochrome n=1 Tax=Burkholderia cenocepacia TaxID=95486 RepID=UPI000981CF3F|nr:c-type cytochrome [Burkholderia cenocepacia]ONZ28706.1 cytochrome C [Burkholderia cenocepacia]ONZ46915.1 cytochrome C [Burkholderia cenocepacia]ONZ74232.1 cytochrome C [Burkholderia cenocepacia]ONZ86628.1 cytochrome C [Burkholderia cenocepacia]ONZ98340.1 cytochrome C [Burkholderia cenocepacia]
MKKRVLLLTAAVATGALLALYGPTLLGFHRLQRHIDTAAQADDADGGPWPRVTDVCMGCHGVKGTSLSQAYPSLAGQPAQYVAAQLRAFAGGQRANPTMGPLAMTMSEAEITRLAGYYAKQAPLDNRYFKPDARLRTKGEQWVTGGACAACHGARLTGQARFPRLAGQGYDYLLAQLDAFATGSRREATGTMQLVAQAMSADDRAAVATYLASLSPATQ